MGLLTKRTAIIVRRNARVYSAFSTDILLSLSRSVAICKNRTEIASGSGTSEKEREQNREEASIECWVNIERKNRTFVAWSYQHLFNVLFVENMSTTCTWCCGKDVSPSCCCFSSLRLFFFIVLRWKFIVCISFYCIFIPIGTWPFEVKFNYKSSQNIFVTYSSNEYDCFRMGCLCCAEKQQFT